MGQNFKKNLGLLRFLPALLLRRHPLHPQEAAQQVHSGHQKGGHRQLLAGLAEAQIILGGHLCLFLHQPAGKQGIDLGIGQHPRNPRQASIMARTGSSIPNASASGRGAEPAPLPSSRPPDRVPAGAGTRISAGESAGRDTRTRPGRWGTERAWPCSRRRGRASRGCPAGRAAAPGDPSPRQPPGSQLSQNGEAAGARQP